AGARPGGGGVDAAPGLEVAAAEDQQPVETLGADGAHEALGVGVRLRGADRRVDDIYPLAAEDLIESAAELAVAVVDQEPHPLEDAGEAEVARLLGHPGARRVSRAASNVDGGFRVRCRRARRSGGARWSRRGGKRRRAGGRLA